MNAGELLACLAEIGASVINDGDRLVLRSGATPVPEEMIAAVRLNKPLLLLLANRGSLGVAESWVSGLARLDPNGPPGDVPATRWTQFIDDACGFIKDGWATCAVGLGWGERDLFGCDRTKPFARVERLGFVWLLNGRPVAGVSAETATIMTPSGGRLTFRRSVDAQQMLPWEMPANDNLVPGDRGQRDVYRQENSTGGKNGQ
jgi:hypothetical protein